jgi:hypothetical protein
MKLARCSFRSPLRSSRHSLTSAQRILDSLERPSIQMPIHQIAIRGETRLQHALNGWSMGFPHDETALLNRLWAKYAATPFCRYGRIPFWCSVATTLVPLHRKGHGSRRSADRYGADLAVTARVIARLPSGQRLNHLKTAFLQLKRANGLFRVKLEAQQITDARSSPGVWDRWYAMAASPTTRRATIGHGPALPTIRSAAKSKWVSAVRWKTSYDWLYEWLSCKEGLQSPLDASGIERHLLTYAAGPIPKLDWITRAGAAPGESVVAGIDSDMDLPDDLIPARGWLVITIIDGSFLG